MQKTLMLFFLVVACCAHRPADPALSARPQALEQRADRYKKDGRYLEALTFYRDIAMNASWAALAGPELYKNMAAIYRNYLGDSQQAAAWYAQYRAAAPDAPSEPAPDKNAFSLQQPLPQDIRVLILDSTEPARIASSGSRVKLTMGATVVSAGADFICSPDNDSIRLPSGGVLYGDIQAIPDNGTSVCVDGKTYRGTVTLRAVRGRLLVINHVPLEEYLRGVLPREMAPSWPLEALKAQAVAARTYALYHMLLRRGEAYDVLATTSSQVYGGSEKEHAAVRAAVEHTRGQVLAFGERLALTLFHANSGGRTEALETIWGGKLAYLCGVADPFSAGYSGAVWEKTLSAEEISSAFAQFGLAAGAIMDIAPIERSASGRIEKLQITAQGGTFFLSGNSFRLIVGPGKVKGTNFEVRSDNGSFVFRGAGYGHGAGMSQWGAFGMAKKGFAYADILGQYYPGTRIVQTAP